MTWHRVFRLFFCVVFWLCMLSIAVSLSGCQQTPQYRLPGRKVGYRLPPCSPTLTPGVPCAQPVKGMTRSECEKLFGYRRCRALFVYGKQL